MSKPINIEIIRTRKELLNDVPTAAGLDRGCSLTKVLYIPKEDTDPDYYDLTCATFLNNNFYDGLMWLIEKGSLPKSGEICVTGVGCDKFRNLIEEKTGLIVRFVDEMFTMVKGNHFLIKNYPNSAICYPNPEISKEVNEISDNLKEIGEQSLTSFLSLKAESELNLTGEKIKFPALVATFGSAAGVFEIKENGTAMLAGGTMLSGRTFMGLGKLLLKTTDYNEIMDLAEKGDISVLGKTIHGSKAEDYDFPIFSFGNVTTNTKLSEHKREDVAIALLHLLASHLYFTLSMSAAMRNVNRIYVGGNLTRSHLFQKLICEKVAFYGKNLLEFHFLKTGHSGAIGAMVSKPNEDEKFEMRFI